MRTSKKNYIVIRDWAGNILFEGHMMDTEVQTVLQANDECLEDIYVEWQDETDCRNVWEYIK